MVPLTSLWLPILVSAVVVFVASSVIHMLLPFHKNDLKRLPREDDTMGVLRPLEIPPGDYFFPLAPGMKEMKEPAFIEKMNRGPVGILTMMPNGHPGMGKALGLWFVYCCVVSLFAAYVVGRALPHGAEYLAVHRFAGVTAFVGYSLALWQNTVWYGKSWVTTLKANVDGLVYGLLTGGAFGWLWPA